MESLGSRAPTPCSTARFLGRAFEVLTAGERLVVASGSARI